MLCWCFALSVFAKALVFLIQLTFRRSRLYFSIRETFAYSNKPYFCHRTINILSKDSTTNTWAQDNNLISITRGRAKQEPINPIMSFQQINSDHKRIPRSSGFRYFQDGQVVEGCFSYRHLHLFLLCTSCLITNRTFGPRRERTSYHIPRTINIRGLKTFQDKNTTLFPTFLTGT